MRELSGPLSFLIEMVTYCSLCNEHFSLGVLQLLKVPQGEGAAQRGQCSLSLYHSSVSPAFPAIPPLASHSHQFDCSDLSLH